MLSRTHAAFAIFLAFFSLNFFEASNVLAFLFFTAFFSLLYDIDEHNSFIGKRARPVSNIIELIFRHRGLLHTLYVPIIFSLVFFIFNKKILVATVLIGYLSHLSLDALTPAGIAPLQPLLKFKIKFFIKTGSIIEFLLFLAFLALDLVAIVTYI